MFSGTLGLSVKNVDTFSSVGIVSLFPDKVFSARSLRPVKFCLTPRAYHLGLLWLSRSYPLMAPPSWDAGLARHAERRKRLAEEEKKGPKKMLKRPPEKTMAIPIISANGNPLMRCLLWEGRDGADLVLDKRQIHKYKDRYKYKYNPKYTNTYPLMAPPCCVGNACWEEREGTCIIPNQFGRFLGGRQNQPFFKIRGKNTSDQLADLRGGQKIPKLEISRCNQELWVIQLLGTPEYLELCLVSFGHPASAQTRWAAFG